MDRRRPSSWPAWSEVRWRVRRGGGPCRTAAAAATANDADEGPALARAYGCEWVSPVRKGVFCKNKHRQVHRSTRAASTHWTPPPPVPPSPRLGGQVDVGRLDQHLGRVDLGPGGTLSGRCSSAEQAASHSRRRHLLAPRWSMRYSDTMHRAASRSSATARGARCRTRRPTRSRPSSSASTASGCLSSSDSSPARERWAALST